MLFGILVLSFQENEQLAWGAGEGDGHAPPVAVAANLAGPQSHVGAECHAQAPPHSTELWGGGQSKLPDDSTVQTELRALL